MIKIKGLTKRYKDLVVFDNFSLEIKEGVITCLLGQSGCGKTTLLNVLAGLTDYSGEADKIKCSYAFQTPNLFPNLTVRNNLKLVCKNESEINRVTERLRLKEKENAFPNVLSGGQKQRVSLARAILYDAEVLLLDEPFSSLDVKTKASALNFCKEEIKKKNQTAIVVTHDIFEAINLADEILVMENGEIVERFSEVNKKVEKRLFDLMLNNYKTN